MRYNSVEESEKNGKVDIMGVRQWYGLPQQDVAKEMNIAGSGLSLVERQERDPSPATMERIFYDVHHACKKLQKQLIEWSHDLEKNTYQQPTDKKFNSIDEEIRYENKMKLYFQPLTEELFMDAVLRIEKGYTVEKIAVHLEIDEEVLIKRLEDVGIPFESVGVDDWKD